MVVSPAWAESVRIGPLLLPAELTLAPHCRGLVVFAQATGAARHSASNRDVARALRAQGFGTLVLDLLARAERATRGCAFDIHALGERLDDVLRWIDGRDDLSTLPLGLFGTGTGVAAALALAAARPDRVGAIVSRMGRPDLAGDALALVKAPTLLIVGTESGAALAQNRAAQHHLGGMACLRVLGSTADDNGPDKGLATATTLAARWFARHLPGTPMPRPQARGQHGSASAGAAPRASELAA